MDYEKAYKESFEAAKGLHDAGNALTKKQMEIVFPQLAESEDERIRKALFKVVSDIAGGWPFESHGITKKDALAYLEKQKGQKIVYEDEYQRMLSDSYKCGKDEVISNPEKYGLQKEQKPAEWSEEDEQWLESIIREYERRLSVDKDNAAVIQIKIDFLKSLRPQSHWKPSDEQIRPLEYAIEYFKKKKNDVTYLESLYEDLQKLL